MKVDVRFKEQKTLITFKKKDLTTLEDLNRVIDMACANYGCGGFPDYYIDIEDLNPQDTVIVIIGIHNETKKPFINVQTSIMCAGWA